MARVRRLVWLRWTLAVRALGQGTLQKVGLAFFCLFIVPAAALGAWFTWWAGYRRLDEPARGELLLVVLGVLWTLWAVSPFLSFGLNQGLDPDRLQPYPVPAGELMAGLALAALLDPWSVPVLLFLVAAAAGWINSVAAAPFVLAALLLAYLHQVALTQVLVNAFAGVLRSRRFRDVVVFLTALLGTGFWLLQQAAVARLGLVRSLDQLVTLGAGEFWRWLPPGWAAAAIRAASAGRPDLAAGWLGALLLGLLLLGWLWVRLVRRLGEVAPGGGSAPAPATAAEARGLGWLGGRVWAVAAKDLRAFWRDPAQRAQFVTSLGQLVWLVAPFVIQGGVQRSLALAPLLIVLVPIWTARDLASNTFGWERGGLATLFALPVPPSRILLGKNLAVALIALAEAGLIATAVGLVAGELLPVAAAAFPALLLATLATGNVLAVTVPRPVHDRMRRPNSNSGAEGCAQAMLALIAFLAQLVVIAPAAAAIAVPLVTESQEWLIVTLPLALLYGAAVYVLGLAWAARRLATRLPEILARCAPVS